MSTSLPGMGAPLSKTPAVSIPSVAAPSVTITERAASKAQSLLAAKGHPDGMLRVFVVGGGCSGFQYGMSIAEGAEAEDQVVEADGGVRIVVDRESVPLISGAEIDYVEDLMKSGFTIYNPNATSSCACGSSFQASGQAGAPRPCN
ncbi:MAG: iron-sulfur cluster assembly accessory protein [Dehalococcoidia bacterium]